MSVTAPSLKSLKNWSRESTSESSLDRGGSDGKKQTLQRWFPVRAVLPENKFLVRYCVWNFFLVRAFRHSLSLFLGLSD